jgi:hypothetical protein
LRGADTLPHTYFVKLYDVNASTTAGSASRRRLKEAAN